MNDKIKYFLIMAIVIIVIVTAIGVSFQERNTPENELPEENKKILTLWHQSEGGGDPVKFIIKDTIEEYENLHPDIKIVEKGFNGERYKVSVKTSFATGNPPDMVYMYSGGSFVKPYIDAGLIIPIDEYLSDDTKENVLQGTTWGCSFDGKLYSLPTVSFLANLYCNEEIFREAGAKIPTTWEELIDACHKIRAIGKTPVAIGEKERWTGMYWYDIIAIRCAGAELVSEALTKDYTLFRDERFLMAAEKLSELVQAGAFDEDIMDLTSGDMFSDFESGKAAMIFQANWVHSFIQADDSPIKDKAVCVPFPEIESGKGDISQFFGGVSDGYYVSSFCEYPEEAVEFVELLSKNIGIRGYQSGIGLPCYRFDDIDDSMLNDIDIQSAELMEKASVCIAWWDNILTTNAADKHKDLVAGLLIQEITPEKFVEEMSRLH